MASRIVPLQQILEAGDEMASFPIAKTQSSPASTPQLRRLVQRVDVVEADKTATKEQERAQAKLEAFVAQLSIACFVLGMFGTALAIASSELLVAHGSEVPVATAFKTITSASTALLLVLLVLLYRSKLDAAKLRGDLHEADNLYSTGLLMPLIVECLVCLLHCPFGVSGTFQVSNLGLVLTHTVDEAMSVVMLARVYLAARVFDRAAGLSGNQARIVSKWNKVDLGLGFTFRSMMERYPLRFVAAVLVIVTLALAYALRVAERPVCDEWGHVVDRCGPYDDSYKHFTTAVWNIVITMTTVGYGDIYPLSHAGRAVALIACFSGVIIVALLVTAVTNTATFEPEERRAFAGIVKASGRIVHRNAAAEMIQSAWAYYRHRLRTIYGLDTNLRFPTWRLMRKPTQVSLRKNVRVVAGVGGGETLVPHGYDVLLYSVHRWRKANMHFFNLSREKSELGMLLTEILKFRGRTNEIAEGLSRQLMVTAALLPNIKAQLDLLCSKLDVPRLPLPALMIPDPALCPGMAKFPSKLVYNASLPADIASGGTSDGGFPIAFMEPAKSVATQKDSEYIQALHSLPSASSVHSASSSQVPPRSSIASAVQGGTVDCPADNVGEGLASSA